MNDLLSDTRFWLTTLGAGILALMRYLWKKQEKRLEQLEADAVRKGELEQLREDLDRRHAENRATLDRIETAVTGTHKRIDAILLPGRREA